MISWSASASIYLHRESVDFRKAINGLSAIVQESMQLDVFDAALYVFCNKRRTHLKVLYWDHTGFALWQKKLEKEKFQWPRKHEDKTIELSHEQWQWLLRGFNLQAIKPHEALFFKDIV